MPTDSLNLSWDCIKIVSFLWVFREIWIFSNKISHLCIKLLSLTIVADKICFLEIG